MRLRDGKATIGEKEETAIEKTVALAEKQTTIQAEGNKKGGLFDLEDQFAFYGQYHVNPVNVWIHIICVPLLFWSFMVIQGCYNLPSLGHLQIGSFGLDFTPNTIYGLIHLFYFLALEPLAGSLYAPLILLATWSSNWLPAHYGAETIKPYFWTLHIAGWLSQFYGHGVHEGRAPALLQNLFQSVVLAVFFVWMEALFKAGYKPELHRRLQSRIGREVAKYRKEKAQAQRAKANLKSDLK